MAYSIQGHGIESCKAFLCYDPMALKLYKLNNSFLLLEEDPFNKIIILFFFGRLSLNSKLGLKGKFFALN